VTVSAIARVRMPWQRVEPFSKARAGMTARWGTGNVRRGWHGGPRAGLERILEKGFVLSAQGRNGRMYGDGVYLAAEDHARISAEFAPADAQGTKHVLLCVVALGSMEQIPFDSTQRRPRMLCATTRGGQSGGAITVHHLGGGHERRHTAHSPAVLQVLLRGRAHRCTCREGWPAHPTCCPSGTAEGPGSQVHRPRGVACAPHLLSFRYC